MGGAFWVGRILLTALGVASGGPLKFGFFMMIDTFHLKTCFVELESVTCIYTKGFQYGLF